MNEGCPFCGRPAQGKGVVGCSVCDVWLREELWNRRTPPGDGGLREAFVEGSKWWEFESTKATMWQSDQNKAWQEAGRRATNGSLGILDPLAPRKAGEGEKK